MSRRGNAASLQDQMAKLHQNMSFRDKRRARQQEMRQSGADDPYDDRATKRVAGPVGNAHGGGRDASSAARAAVASASAIDGPDLFKCDTCSVSFAVESQMMQHLAGPTHKKTVERAAAEERRLQQLGNNRWAAENAAASATWQQNTRYTPAARQPVTVPPAREGEMEPLGGSLNSPATTSAAARITAAATFSGAAPGGGGHLAKPPPFRPKKLTPEEAERAAVAERARIAHANRVAAAQRISGPPSIGGWVPPTVPSASAAPATVCAVSGADDSNRDEDDNSLKPSAVIKVEEEKTAKQENQDIVPGCANYSSSDSEDSDSDSSCGDGGVPRQRPISFF